MDALTVEELKTELQQAVGPQGEIVLQYHPGSGEPFVVGRLRWGWFCILGEGGTWEDAFRNAQWHLRVNTKKGTNDDDEFHT